MSTTMRRLFLCLIGLLAGLAVWPVVEAILRAQAGFPSYLAFSVALGLASGLIMGGFWGTADGIALASAARMRGGLLMGALIGAAGGAAGFLVGQAAIFYLGDVFIGSREFKYLGFPLARAIGWAAFGLFLGLIDGLRSLSGRKIQVGIAGGLVGGFLGGLALEYARLLINNIELARLLGLLVFGLLVGVAYGFVESRLSAGVLRILNGKYRSKEYVINQRKFRIGGSRASDVELSAYPGVVASHAVITVRRKKMENEVSIRSADSAHPVIVNDDKVKGELRLRPSDVIQVGSAKLLYKLG
jgi:MFS family permease